MRVCNRSILISKPIWSASVASPARRLRGYEIADALRARGITVVFGGVHATLLPDEAARHADAVVTGYAEQTWPELLRDFARGELKPRYFKPTGRSLAGVPHARRDLLDRRKYSTINSIEATRGCPHKCDFCAVPAAWANTYAHRPVEEVVAELATFEGRHALFIDLSPVEDVAYAKALYRAMIPLGIRWVGLATTRIAEDEELLKLAAQSGCKGLLIGFESVSQDTLNQTHKQFHSATNYAEVVKRLHDHGIGIQGCFVFGFDNDDEDVFERTVEFVDRTRIDLPRYAVMTPFPGTGAFRQLEAQGRLLHKNWSLYDVEHVVFQPRNMSPERLQEGLEWSWRQSYSWRSMGRRFLGAPPSIWPLWASLNLGYKHYARHLPAKIGPEIYRDPAFIQRARIIRSAATIAPARRPSSPSTLISKRVGTRFHAMRITLIYPSVGRKPGRPYVSRLADAAAVDGGARRAHAARLASAVLRRPDGGDSLRRADRSGRHQRRNVHRAAGIQDCRAVSGPRRAGGDGRISRHAAPRGSGEQGRRDHRRRCRTGVGQAARRCPPRRAASKSTAVRRDARWPASSPAARSSAIVAIRTSRSWSSPAAATSNATFARSRPSTAPRRTIAPARRSLTRCAAPAAGGSSSSTTTSSASRSGPANSAAL